MSKTVNLGGRPVGEGHPTFIIAEAGSNHNGEMTLAKELAAAAKEAGCDCVKFQTFTAEEFCADRTKTFTYRSQGKTVTESEFEMYQRLQLSRDQWAELMAYCNKLGIFFLTTIQDAVNLDMMVNLGLQAIKVGSDDFDHLVNLKRDADTGLPLILSKGMADLGEVDRVLGVMRSHTDKLMVMHCVSLYPSEPEYLNLRQIPLLASLYPDVVWGFSDHSRGTVAATAAVALGAHLIEKHFTLDHDLPGADHWFALDVPEMAQLVRDVRFCDAALGSGCIAPSEVELDSKPIMRRRLVAMSDLPSGTVLSESTVAFKRADRGGFIDVWDVVKNHRLARPKRANEGIDLGDVEFG